MRLFVAVNLPEPVRNQLYADTAALRATTDRVRWVAAPSLHVTLKFLGQQDDQRVGDLERALALVAGRHPPIDVRTGEVGAFPNFRRPRVVWVGMTGAAALTALAEDIDRTLAGLGVPTETRPFRAHLTLGRVKEEIKPAEARVLETAGSAPIAPRGFSIRTVDLMQSELGPGGSRYSVVAAVPLHARGT
jgi:RNA 2',3'-cyclic 3'-phosphodiesterase